ncbi:MAG: hypothetical protein DMF95_35110, partial [Acidobacteria bacterium]
MQFWTYLLTCADGSYYVGHTDDLEKRLAAHQDGSFAGYTARRRPVTLLRRRVPRFHRGERRCLDRNLRSSLQRGAGITERSRPGPRRRCVARKLDPLRFSDADVQE